MGSSFGASADAPKLSTLSGCEMLTVALLRWAFVSKDQRERQSVTVASASGPGEGGRGPDELSSGAARGRNLRSGVANAAKPDRACEGQQPGNHGKRHPETAEVEHTAGHGADGGRGQQAGDARDRVVDAGGNAGGARVSVGEDRRRERRDGDGETERENRHPWEHIAEERWR